MGLLEDLKKKKMARSEDAIMDEGPNEKVKESEKKVVKPLQSVSESSLESPKSADSKATTGKIFPAQRKRAILGK